MSKRPSYFEALGWKRQSSGRGWMSPDKRLHVMLNDDGSYYVLDIDTYNEAHAETQEQAHEAALRLLRRRV